MPRRDTDGQTYIARGILYSLRVGSPTNFSHDLFMGNQPALFCRLYASDQTLQKLEEFLLPFVMRYIHEDSGGFSVLGNDDRPLGCLHLR